MSYNTGMDERCRKCALPGIMETLRSSKAGAQAAQVNAKEAGSPTEQARYQQIADTLAAKLRAAYEQHQDFIEMWGSACDGCQY